MNPETDNDLQNWSACPPLASLRSWAKFPSLSSLKRQFEECEKNMSTADQDHSTPSQSPVGSTSSNSPTPPSSRESSGTATSSNSPQGGSRSPHAVELRPASRPSYLSSVGTSSTSPSPRAPFTTSGHRGQAQARDRQASYSRPRQAPVRRTVPFGRSAVKTRMQRRSSGARSSAELRSTYPQGQGDQRRYRRSTSWRLNGSSFRSGDKSPRPSTPSETPNAPDPVVMSILNSLSGAQDCQESIHWADTEGEEMKWA